jgi:hypothetical protein
MPEGYLHLTCEQRCQIYALLQSGHSQAQKGSDLSIVSDTDVQRVEDKLNSRTLAPERYSATELLVRFSSTLNITILCGVANITMAAQFGTAWKMGVGALIGLLGGKTVRWGVYLTADSRDAGAGCWRESRNQICFAPDS